MSLQVKKSMGWTLVLIALGIFAFFAGPQWLTILVPAALLVWHSAVPVMRNGRN